MYYKKFYHNLDPVFISKTIENEGFNPTRIHNSPGDIYSLHKHPETKLLAFLQGSMKVTVNNDTYTCVAGDKLIIEGNVMHSAVVGDQGCEFFWSEKLL